jgi:hypothetical protein
MCLSACIGLLPAALSTGIGSETQRPLATVIVGGMLLAPLLILLIVPVLISFLRVKPDVDDLASLTLGKDAQVSVGTDGNGPTAQPSAMPESPER